MKLTVYETGGRPAEAARIGRSDNWSLGAPSSSPIHIAPTSCPHRLLAHGVPKDPHTQSKRRGRTQWAISARGWPISAGRAVSTPHRMQFPAPWSTADPCVCIQAVCATQASTRMARALLRRAPRRTRASARLTRCSWRATTRRMPLVGSSGSRRRRRARCTPGRRATGPTRSRRYVSRVVH